MAATTFDNSPATLVSDPIAVIRARAVADARVLRALARAAQSDGLPKAELRSANARAGARRVLEHARRLSSLARDAVDGLRPAELAE